MKLRNPFLIRLVALAASLVIRLWMATLRKRLFFHGGKIHPTDPRKERFIYSFWHETLLAPTVIKARVTILISLHADGEFIAQVCRFLGYGVARGSPKRGAITALLDMLKHAERTHLVMTPDGPLGPRRQLKAGMVYLASRTGMPIVPLGIGYSKCWRARSWDRFALPHPFSTMVGMVGEAIYVPPDLDRAELERYRQLVEERCLAITEIAEQFAERGTTTRTEVKRNEERKACA